MYMIKENLENEIIINKSKFITKLYKVDSVIEINEILKNLKKEYKDATHICYAYIVGNNKKCSDDKEPKNTAGMPMLSVLENKELTSILSVVIRYFGGIKLGAGGLLRAYSNSVSEALLKTNIIPYKKEHKIKIEFKYDDISSINYYLKDYKITYKEFDINVIYEFIYEDDNYPTNIDIFLIKKEPIS